MARIIEAAAKSGERPLVLVAHSLGVAAAVFAATEAPAGLFAGAFFVAPADVDNAAGSAGDGRTRHSTWRAAVLRRCRRVALPFPSMVIASANDPYCSLERARDMAQSWGSELVEAGDAGHINVNSGHGPWPDGPARFGMLLKRLEPGSVGAPAS